MLGAIGSATAGFVGMRIATQGNTRTASAAMVGLNPALRVAFRTGTVMGMTVVGVGLLGVTVLWFIFQNPSVVAGFAFGASSIALFARVGGGIYTKAADVGADLVGKVEAALADKVHLRSTPGRRRLVFQPNGGNAGPTSASPCVTGAAPPRR